MHRLLRERGTSGERRAQAVHPARKKPELLATAPDQVWSWDITKLKGPARGIWYLLYVILDIYSRKVIHWEMHTPVSVHDGTWTLVQARRAATLQAAYQAHPERFRGGCPQPKDLPARVWINEPPATIETSTSPQTARAA